MANNEITKKFPYDKNLYYNLLEEIGYTKSLAEKRIKIYDNAEVCSTKKLSLHAGEYHVRVVIAGSRGEGVTVYIDSDIDTLYVQRCAKCFENCQTLSLVETKLFSVLFEMEFDNMPTGYVKLRLVALNRLCHFGRNVRDSLFQLNNSFYLGNSLFSNMHRSWGEFPLNQKSVFFESTGPARMYKLEFPLGITLHFDHIQAIPCEYPSVVDAWCKRDRQHSWPSAEVIETVKALNVLVVPTGVSDTFGEGLQWRISMTLAERALVRSFNDHQIKLYAAMKMIVKQELKILCNNITSYIVKNIVLWVFEKYNLNYSMNNFIINMGYLLKYLKFCLFWRHLPSYTMPAKNMFECKVSVRERTVLIKQLDMLIDGIPYLLHRCPLVTEKITEPSTEFQRKVFFRELLEQIILSVVSTSPAEYIINIEKLRRALKRNYHNKTQTLIELVKIFRTGIIPRIRKTNPLGFFTHVMSMSDDEIVFRFLEGIRLDYLREY